MSFGWFIVTTSACSPCSTDSACALDAPCDCLIVTVSPVCCLYAAAKLALMSLYSSRVTSYDTLRIDVSACAAVAATTSAAAVPACSQRPITLMPAIAIYPVSSGGECA